MRSSLIPKKIAITPNSVAIVDTLEGSQRRTSQATTIQAIPGRRNSHHMRAASCCLSCLERELAGGWCGHTTPSTVGETARSSHTARTKPDQPSNSSTAAAVSRSRAASAASAGGSTRPGAHAPSETIPTVRRARSNTPNATGQPTARWSTVAVIAAFATTAVSTRADQPEAVATRAHGPRRSRATPSGRPPGANRRSRGARACGRRGGTSRERAARRPPPTRQPR